MKKLLILLLIIIQVNIYANTKMADSITIENGYIRMMPPTMSMTAAFMKLKNTSSKDIVLKSLESDLAVFTELHTSIQNSDGTASMKHIEKLIIKANSYVMLQKGGKHIMFMRLKDKLKLNNIHTIILHFSDNSTKTFKLKIEKK